MVHLDIERNRVSEHGARYLGRVLRHNVVLLELLVSWNMFRARGGLAIAYGLLPIACYLLHNPHCLMPIPLRSLDEHGGHG